MFVAQGGSSAPAPPHMPDPAAIGIDTCNAPHLRSAPSWISDAGLLALLGGELVGLSTAFDTWRLDALPSVSAHLVAWSPQAIRLAIAVVSVAVVLDARRVLTALRHATRTSGGSRLAALALHGVSVAAFAWLTSRLVNGDVAALPLRSVWTLVWLATGGLAMVAWATALFPRAVWWDEIRPHRSALALGVAGGVAIWASGFVTQEFWQPMARVTFGVVASVLGVFSTQTVVDPTTLIVGTTHFKVVITPACSGYEGIGLILTFLSIYLWLFRKDLRFPAAFLLLPLGAVTIWVANIVRIVGLIGIGTAGWPKVAAGGFHSQAGWITFNVIALGFVAWTFRSGYFRAEETQAATSTEPADSTVALLAPFVAVTATAMLTGALASDVDWLYPLRVLAVGGVLWVFRRDYAPLVRSWTWSWWPVAIGTGTSLVWVGLSASAPARTGGWALAIGSLPAQWAAFWVLFRVVGYVMMAPIAEELAFRAYLTRRLESAEFERVPLRRFAWIPFLGSSVLFGVLHGHLWIAGTVAGMAFAFALYRRRALTDAVVAHAVTNALLAVYASATGHWAVWS